MLLYVRPFCILHVIWSCKRNKSVHGCSPPCGIEIIVLGLGTNYGEGGGLQNGRGGGHVKFYPYEKGGGGGKSFSHAEGGAQKVLG